MHSSDAKTEEDFSSFPKGMRVIRSRASPLSFTQYSRSLMELSDSKSGDFTTMVVGDFWPIFKKWWALFKVAEKVLH